MIALFDPRGIPTSDYKQRYPELGRIDEYRPLSSNELVFVWWFANPTSPLMKKPLSEASMRALSSGCRSRRARLAMRAMSVGVSDRVGGGCQAEGRQGFAPAAAGMPAG